MTIPRAPEGAKAAGKRLWRSVVTGFELAEHEMSLLVQAVHVADTCADLQQIIDRDGLMLETEMGTRTHPAAIELRQQRLVLARLVVALRVPIGDQEQDPARTAPARLQRRGVRGIYTIGGGRAS